MPFARIDVIVDFITPWCFIAKRRLELALQKLGAADAAMDWLPFLIAPDVPPEGLDYRAALDAHLGPDYDPSEDRRRISAAGEPLGIRFNWDKLAWLPNTLDAHRLTLWAGWFEADLPGVKERMVELLLHARYEAGLNIGDRAVLLDLAARLGLPADELGQRLETDAERDLILARVAALQQAGIAGVPCLIVDGKRAVAGALEPDGFAQALRY